MASGDSPSKMDGNEINMPAPKIRHEWYQTETDVIITILAKNVENVKTAFQEKALSVSALLPSGNQYSLELDLAHPILPDQCSHRAVPSKLEVKLRKRDGIRWNAIEGSPTAQAAVQPIPQEILQACTQPPKYPSSSKQLTDWNKVEKEIAKQEADEQSEGEAALNALIQRIYCSGTDDVRRAMNKSFQESGGTVLSTNWSEVGKGKVEKKPPAGVEWKPWNS